MMDNYMHGGYGEYNTLSIDDVQREISDSLKNAEIDQENNIVRYTGKNIELVMLGGHGEADVDNHEEGEEASENGEEFIVGGLVNPTVYIPKEVKVNMKLINTDPEMPHGIILTSSAPPYSYMSMMNSGYAGVTVPIISKASENKFPVAEITFTGKNAGEYYYICQVQGHAAEGMYGKIIFE